MSWMRVACILGFLGVAIGAFGAHAIRGKVPTDLLDNYKTGVLYHFVHTLALMVWANWRTNSGQAGNLVGWAFTIGILFFSGSLYLMTLTGWRWLGAVTPIGGLAFLLGWAVLAWKA